MATWLGSTTLMLHFATIKTVIKPFCTKKSIFVAAFAIVLAFIAASPAGLLLEQNTSLAQLFKIRGYRPTPQNVVIIALNSNAHQQLHPSVPGNFWPRQTLAKAITLIAKADAKLIALDIALKEARDENGDASLEQAIADAGNVMLFTYLKREHLFLPRGLADIEQVQPPIKRFAKHALGSGTFTLPKGGMVHYTDLTSHPGGVPIQPLMVTEALAPSNPLITAPPKRFYINYYGPARSFQTWDIDQLLLQPEKILPKLKNALVYIGYLEMGQTEQVDTYPTVFTTRLGVDLSGVEISATVSANLLENSAIQPTRAWVRAFWILVLVVTVSLIGLVRPLLLWPACAALLVIIWNVGVLRFSANQWWPLSLYTLAIIGAGAFAFIQTHLQQKSHLRNVRRALQQHLPNHAAHKLSLNLVNLEKEHSLVYGVCLVTDIRGYTALAESIPPDELHRLMNRYYAELVSAVEECNGFVGNIVGDSLVALWTGPTINSALCENAYKAVTIIQNHLKANPDLNTQLPTCIALHAGQFSLGHLGAQGHFEYSPVGDMINTATRIEHFNRTLGTEFLCTKLVAEQLLLLNEPPSLLHLGAFTMRNRANTTELYSICNQADLKTHFTKALQLYLNGQKDGAKALFETLDQQFGYGPGRHYLAQCIEQSSSN